MKDTIYAQVLGGVVVNIIVLNDLSLLPVFAQGYDFFIDVTNLPQYPGPGDLYDGKNFTSSVTPADTAEDQVSEDKNVGDDILTEIFAENKLAKISDQQVIVVNKEYGDVFSLIKEGELVAAIVLLEQIGPDKDFVTQQVLDSWIQKLKSAV